MQQWPEKGDPPTWTVIRNPGVDQSYNDLLIIANKCYNWVAAQNNKKADPILVAALYDPVEKKVYVSTIPRGPFKTAIRRLPNTSTYKQQAQQIQFTGQDRYHSEDGAMFLYETEGPARYINWQYPQGSMFAVYGRRSENDATPEARPPCSEYGEESRRPGCQQVLRWFGVNWQNQDQRSQQADSQRADNTRRLQPALNRATALRQQFDQACTAVDTPNLSRLSLKELIKAHALCKTTASTSQQAIRNYVEILRILLTLEPNPTLRPQQDSAINIWTSYGTNDKSRYDRIDKEVTDHKNALEQM